MPSVFTQCDGRVVVVSNPTGCPDKDPVVFGITFDGKKTLESVKVPVTGFALEQQGNYQFLHTLNNFTYCYIFGDRIGELTISGMGFAQNATNGAGGGADAWSCGADSNIGSLCNLFGWYQDNRVSASSSKTMAITLNGGACGSFWAFLTGMRMEMPRAEILIAQWTLRFNVIQRPSAADGLMLSKPSGSFGLIE
jgi:hypothetical protein